MGEPQAPDDSSSAGSQSWKGWAGIGTLFRVDASKKVCGMDESGHSSGATLLGLGALQFLVDAGYIGLLFAAPGRHLSHLDQL